MTDIEKDTIVVFTARSPERIIREGGSQAWVLNPARAKLCKWLVCTQNRHHPNHEFSDATEPHGAAFLVARVTGIAQSREEGAEDRWIVHIGDFARVNMPGVWDQWRNPVRYTSLDELGIRVEDLLFEPQPASVTSPGLERVSPHDDWPPATLTIAEAKRALAATFGVSSDAVEITIRG